MSTSSKRAAPVQDSEESQPQKKLKGPVIADGKSILMWFRTDLRTLDNTALFAASQSALKLSLPLVALFIVSPQEWKNHLVAPIKVDFCFRALQSLSTTLSSLGIPLLIKEVPTKTDVIQMVKQTCTDFKASELWYNIEYEVNESRRDAKVQTELATMGINVLPCHDQCVVRPGLVKTKEGKDYTVFTPFKNSWIAYVESKKMLLKLKPAPSVMPSLSEDISALVADHLKVPSFHPDFRLDDAKAARAKEAFPASEAHAQSRLTNFVNTKITKYGDDRDKTFMDGTSALSPYLASGLISARQCLEKAMAANGNKLAGQKGPSTWISEIIWREFYRQVLVAFPRVCMNKSFKPEGHKIVWKDDEEAFRAWCQGRTGFPIVDAGMRQLNETGWMHNRARMIVASFLAKDLLINWKRGENYFHEHLIDADLASNNGGWQWAASTGTDSQPYFRIFNPLLQSEKFDPDGKFIRKYVPELASLKGKAIHDPTSALGVKGVEKLGYVKPIVDHKAAKDAALAAYALAFKKTAV
ncbi:hypothetical protein SmJEL517_g04922 [Synchytrium microbalum]|uniref:Photolyase/cryptochrome alpha/beta domain-containing protein n=1 Tax=Synchytrium microbalum TaxID=1806994 RepID=A0A507BXL4_9FUNG|nr:uncharacterized protein SmJEL517_g04922 [Synchytrium microbalum]TPX31878.1 hypothetical protein SmJEL517_g04922 [Synchytrium microbalum]